REPADLAAGADHGRDLELVVELLGADGVWNLVVGPEDRRGVGEVEDRDFVPLVGHAGPARHPRRVLDVLLERVEVAYGGRPLDGREQPHLAERVLVVLARRAAAGEERLEALRREVDDAVTLHLPEPPAEVARRRREHAELHVTALCGRSGAR